MIFRIRESLGTGLIGSLMDCFYCLSLWVALPLGLYLGLSWPERILYWLALSASAIIIQRVVIKDDDASAKK